jgi:hypothetical protein
MFDFKHIGTFERHLADEPGPMVLFASPGMLHAGMSLDIFKKWCGDPRNMIVLPGYCVPGTVGAKVLAGDKVIEVDKNLKVKVELQVRNLSFSAHADAKGILQLIQMCQPRFVMLVHGEARKMAVLKKRILAEMGITCFDPANGTSITVPTEESMPAVLSTVAVRRAYREFYETQKKRKGLASVGAEFSNEYAIVPFQGALVLPHDNLALPRLVDIVELEEEFGMKSPKMRFRIKKPFDLWKHVPDRKANPNPVEKNLKFIKTAVERWKNVTGNHSSIPITLKPNTLIVGPVNVSIFEYPDPHLLLEWDNINSSTAIKIISLISTILLLN